MERNTPADVSEPLNSARWKLTLLNNAEQERLVADQARMFQQQELPWLPAFQPLAVQEHVLFRDPEKLIAVDVTTGKRVLGIPLADAENLFPDSAADSLSENDLRQRLWLNSPMANLVATVNECSWWNRKPRQR